MVMCKHTFSFSFLRIIHSSFLMMQCRNWYNVSMRKWDYHWVFRKLKIWYSHRINVASCTPASSTSRSSKNIKTWASGRVSNCNIYQESVLSWFVFLMITCVTGRAGYGGWQRWRDNGPRPAWVWDVAEQLWEQCAPSDSALSPLLSSGKLWSESHQTWDLWHCPFSLPVPDTDPSDWGPAELLTHRRESMPGLTSALANIPMCKLSCTWQGQLTPAFIFISKHPLA